VENAATIRKKEWKNHFVGAFIIVGIDNNGGHFEHFVITLIISERNKYFACAILKSAD
jgi:hypothetical protein